MGIDGEAAVLFSELLLCKHPQLPVQFALSASVRHPLSTVLQRAPGEIFGKHAERIVLGLGLHELKMGAELGEALKAYRVLVEEILSKTSSVLYLLTVPVEMLPERTSEVERLNAEMFSLEDRIRVHVLDFAKQVKNFEEDQVKKGKFARSLYDSNALPTSLCHALLGLFIECGIFNKEKEFENGHG